MGLIYAAGDVGVTLTQLRNVTGLPLATVKKIIVQVNRANQKNFNSPFQIMKIQSQYQLVTKRDLHPDLKKFFKDHQTSILTSAELEALTVIAYRQPITRIEVDEVRGVNSSVTIQRLLRQKLIRKAGHKKVVGTPLLYRTTTAFLNLFGLSSLAELPKLKRKS